MSQGNLKDAVDQYITEQRDAQHVPGLPLAAVRGGHVIHARGYGLANLALAVPATPDTVYQIGSITKQFTAVAVMMLVEEGKSGWTSASRARAPFSTPGCCFARIASQSSGRPGKKPHC